MLVTFTMSNFCSPADNGLPPQLFSRGNVYSMHQHQPRKAIIMPNLSCVLTSMLASIPSDTRLGSRSWFAPRYQICTVILWGNRGNRIVDQERWISRQLKAHPGERNVQIMLRDGVG